MEADIIVTGTDLLEAPIEALDKPDVLATFLGGELVYGGQAFDLA